LLSIGGWNGLAIVRARYCLILGLLVVDLEEEEAAKCKAEGTPSKELKERAGISRKEHGTEEGEEEGT
jgi:hypothetical protein